MRKDFGAQPFLFPQPVLIIATYDEEGKANAMNAAWGGIVGRDEIMIDLSQHKTTDNLKKNRAFTVSFADVEHVVACDYVGIVSGAQESDKMKKAGFTTTKSTFVNAPIINELPVTMECELIDIIDGSKYLGKSRMSQQTSVCWARMEQSVWINLSQSHMSRFIIPIMILVSRLEKRSMMEHS